MQKMKKSKTAVVESVPTPVESEEEESEEEEMEQEESEVDDDVEDEAENENKEKPVKGDGEPPAKKIKKDKKAEKPAKEETEEDVFKRKLIVKGDVIRRKSPKSAEQQALQELKDMLNGKYVKYVYNHVTSRVVEWMVKLSGANFTAGLVKELKPALKTMAKMKYSNHVVLRIIEKADKPTMEIIHQELATEVIKMLTLKTSVQVLTELFKKCSNEQKQVLRNNFYGNSFKIFKGKQVETLKDVTKLSQTEKDSIFNEINDNLNKVMEKDGFKSDLVMSVLKEYMELMEVDSAKHTALVSKLQKHFADLNEFKEGDWLAAHCLWHSSAKERKGIMKTCKDKLKEMAMCNVGSTILMAMMDCIDDTTLFNKIVLQPLLEDCFSVTGNINGVRLLAFAVRPRSTVFIHPEKIKFLELGDSNQHSKKDLVLRQKEIRNFATPAIASVVKKDISLWMKDAHRFLLMKVLLEDSEFQEVKDVMEEFATLLCDKEYKLKSVFKGKESENLLIEMPFPQKLAMHLVKEDKRKFAEDPSYKPVFTDMLLSQIKSCPSVWSSCNRGILTFLCMMETEIPYVVKEVKQILTPLVKDIKLMAEQNKASEELLKLLGDTNSSDSVKGGQAKKAK